MTGGDGVTLTVARAVLDDTVLKAADIIRVQRPIQVIQVVQQEPAAVGIAPLSSPAITNCENLREAHPSSKCSIWSRWASPRQPSAP